MENKKIAVKDFVEQYVSAKTDIDKKKVLQSLEVKTYIPYSVKVVHSQVVLDSTAKRVNGVLLNDSPMRYLTQVMSIVRLYTNLSINQERPHEDYDLLRQNNLIDMICEKIGEDVAEFQTVFNMVWGDMVNNENDIRVYIASQVANFAALCSDVAGSDEFMKNISALNSAIEKYGKTKPFGNEKK